MSASHHRSRVLALYRAFLREAKQMPTENRMQHVQRKAGHDFRQFKGETDPHTIEFQVRLAETQLDNVVMQRRLLTQLAEEGNLKGPR